MNTYTAIHVVISLLAIGSGFVVLFGMLTGRRLDAWTAFFLATTVATSVTGFGFPIHGFTPGIGVGIISLIVLAVAIFARYGRHLAGAWRRVYVVTAVTALYLNVFVLIVQSFQKVPALKALARRSPSSRSRSPSSSRWWRSSPSAPSPRSASGISRSAWLDGGGQSRPFEALRGSGPAGMATDDARRQRPAVPGPPSSG